MNVGSQARLLTPNVSRKLRLFAGLGATVCGPLHLGVDFISYQEHIDTTTPQGEMIFTVMASLAQFESALSDERVKAGIARAKAQGKWISRAPIAEALQVRIAALYAEGLSIHQISKRLGSGYGTAWNYVQRAK